MNFINHHLASPETMVPNYGRIASERNKNWRHTVSEYISNLEHDYHVSIGYIPSIMESDWTAEEIRAEYEHGISFSNPACDKFDVFDEAINVIESLIREARYPQTECDMVYLRYYFDVVNRYAPALMSEIGLSLAVDAFAPLFLKEEEEEILMLIPPKENLHQHDRYTCMKQEKVKLHARHVETGSYGNPSYNKHGWDKKYMKNSYKRGNRKTRKTFDLPSGKSGWKKIGSSAYF